jgi:hypothetical protein
MAEPSPAMTVLRYCTFLTTPSRKGGVADSSALPKFGKEREG